MNATNCLKAVTGKKIEFFFFETKKLVINPIYVMISHHILVINQIFQKMVRDRHYMIIFQNPLSCFYFLTWGKISEITQMGNNFFNNYNLKLQYIRKKLFFRQLIKPIQI
jgi:hypothetical protein